MLQISSKQDLVQMQQVVIGVQCFHFVQAVFAFFGPTWPGNLVQRKRKQSNLHKGNMLHRLPSRGKHRLKVTMPEILMLLRELGRTPGSVARSRD